MNNRKPLTIAVTAMLSAALALPVAAGDYDKDRDDRMDRSAGEVIDDMSIAARLKAELAADPTTDAMDIDIEVDRDQVQLNGFVDSEEAIERAEEIAMNLEGVKSVENNLEVGDDYRTGQYLDDRTIQARLKTALAENDMTEARNIDIEVNDGIVSLGGHLDTQKQIDAAEKVARQVEGVRDVRNNLAVRQKS